MLAVAGVILPASATAAAAAPWCVPKTLDASAVLAGTPLLVSPSPGSSDAMPQNQISFLGAPASTIAALTVTGSQSGAHPGTLEPYSQGDGASFVPAQAFDAGETVTVSGSYTPASGGAAVPFSFSFTVGTPDQLAEIPETGVTTGAPGTILHFHSAPSVTPPNVKVAVDTQQAQAGGDIFFSVYPGPGQTGPEIMSPNGQLVWFDPLPTGTFATNVEVQHYLGQEVLTWWQGVISHHGYGIGQGELYNTSYQQVATVSAGNGLAEDLHELQLTPSGTALITAWKPLYCNLAAAGGSASGAIYDPVMQEIDVKTGLVMYEWDSLDHVPLSDSHAPAAAKSTTIWPWDWFHMNSLQLQLDGSFLISSRATWTVYDVNSTTGQIVWELGGRQSTFKIGPGADFSWQHDARQLGPDLYTLFDNDGPPSTDPASRGLVIKIDPTTHSATLAHAAVPPTPIYAQTQGDLEPLAGQNWWLEFGDVGEMLELSSSGKVLFMAHSPNDTQIYRALRFPWSAQPVTPPALAVDRPTSGPLELWASWNGATDVASWRVLAGPTATALTAGATTRDGGFETKLSAPSTAAFVAVQALSANGAVLATSAPEPA
ncbi:MAG: arylsulfotransferase family protein [Solirubrobacteraceae bacterium]